MSKSKGEVDIPNDETVAAMREVDEMIRSGSGQRFKGAAADFFAMLDAESDDLTSSE